jgi:voltage-gated potassium channel
VIKKNTATLLSLLVCAIFYIFVSALLIFSIEPDSFDSFFEAIYWATTALTTVGYGDIYPLTDGGRIISMISSLFGIAMVALPSGVITAGFLSEKNIDKKGNDL